jgi:homoserine dehydrogenase
MNAIQYETDLLGIVTLIGPGAGRKETAAALLEDLITIYK